MMMHTKTIFYITIYKFLKENGILINYLENISKQYPYTSYGLLEPKKKTKEILKLLVDRHFSWISWNHRYRGDRASASIFLLFSYYGSSFIWYFSKEGPEFWKRYDVKWRKYVANLSFEIEKNVQLS